MQLTKIDALVIDLAADDYCGLWEICEYFIGLMPNDDAIVASAECRANVSSYVRAGLIEVFKGRMVSNDFYSVPKDEAQMLLAQDSSWQRPDNLSLEVVAILSTEKGVAAATVTLSER